MTKSNNEAEPDLLLFACFVYEIIHADFDLQG